ncbi:MAG: Holliday junction resolvase-like protein [Candidatus Aenigmarchaeota archaeon]|nr:Holliday junction resolvase-like protein [Candidatus Aenigmarchaeota archaeon]
MFLEFIIILLFVAIVYLLFKNREWKIKFEQRIKEWKEIEEEKIREDAIIRSARALSGKTLEKLVPFLKAFPYDPHDIRWLGDPIDLVIFDGYSSAQGKGLNQIVFCEVKSGNSRLTAIQNRIKELVERKKVKWEEFRV